MDSRAGRDRLSATPRVNGINKGRGSKALLAAYIAFRMTKIATMCLVGIASLAIAACAGGSSTPPPPTPNPVPSVSSLAPTSVTAGGGSFVLTVNGSNFVASSLVQWNGSTRGTTYVSATQLTASIAAVDIALGGTANVAVVNPAPGGGTSGTMSFPFNNPIPMLSSVSPNPIASGSPGVSLTLHGAGFVATSTVLWNGVALANTLASATQLVTTVPASRLLTLGDILVSVQNPGPGGGTATALAVHIGGLLRASVTRDGSNVDGGSTRSAASADGRYVAFASQASSLVAADANAVFDVFVRDTCLGAATSCVPVTQRVSVATDGTEGNGDSGWTTTSPEIGVAISGSGHFVAFVSAASNLVPGDTDSVDDVFVRDTCIGAAAGCTSVTVLASVGVGGAAGVAASLQPTISRSGRFVAFTSFAANLVPGDANADYDIFMRDTCIGAPNGCVPSTSRASVSSSDAEGNSTSLHPAFSGDERYLAFSSMASNLVPGDTNGAQDVFLRDTCFGAALGCTPSTARVSLSDAGAEGNVRSLFPKVSLDGRYVAFVSEASNLVAGDTNTVADLYIRDTCLNAPPGCAATTVRASLTNAGIQAGVDGIWQSSLSDNGRYAAFESSGSHYVPTDPSPTFNVFVRDTCLGAAPGCVPSTLRVSAAFDGTPPDNQCVDPSLSADGRFISFTSGASNLLPGAPMLTYPHIYLSAAH